MPYFVFDQNNSGGSFMGPALYVIVEAVDTEEANRRAESNGVYFNGCDTGSDCECCGDRWYPQYNNDRGTSEPMIYDKTIEAFLADPDSDFRKSCSKADKVPMVLIVYADGRTETK